MNCKQLSTVRSAELLKFVKNNSPVLKIDAYNHLYQNDKYYFCGIKPKSIGDRKHISSTILRCTRDSNGAIEYKGEYLIYVGESERIPPPPADYDGEIFTKLEAVSKEFRKEFRNDTDIFKDLPYPCKILILSDFHLANLFTDYKYVKYVVDTIRADPSIFVLLLGDMRDTCGTINTPGNSFSDSYGTFAEMKLMKVFLDGIGDRVIGYVFGNHELRDERAVGYGIDEHIYNEYIAGPKTRAYYKRMYLTFGDKTYYFFIQHKLPGGSYHNPCYGGFKLITMRPILDSANADVVIGAHTHNSAVMTLTHGDKERILIVSGSRMIDSTFGDIIGVDYSESPYPMIVVTENKNLIAFRDFEKALEVL